MKILNENFFKRTVMGTDGNCVSIIFEYRTFPLKLSFSIIYFKVAS